MVAVLVLDRQEKEAPWEGHPSGAAEVPESGETVTLLEPKVREERWGSMPPLWVLIIFSVKQAY